MSMVTLGDAVFNSGLNWLITAKASLNTPNGWADKFPKLLSIPEANGFEWTVNPLGFEYSSGIQIYLRDLTPEQKIDLLVQSVKQWGKHCYYGTFRNLVEKYNLQEIEPYAASIIFDGDDPLEFDKNIQIQLYGKYTCRH